MESRSTFREKATDGVCWQKILRDDRAEPAPPVDLTLSTSRVRRVSNTFAEQIILKYEWLGTMGAGTMRCYGIFFGMYCAGVTCFATSGGIPVMPKMFKVKSPQMSYLSRGACVSWAPPGTNSRLLAKSCQMEADAGVKLVMAFADTDAGEIGTVYQASNWHYIGRGEASWFQWVSPQGKIWSFNALTHRVNIHGGTVKGMERKLLADGWTKQRANPKHRYVYLVDRDDAALVALLNAKKQPYPKRAKWHDAGNPSAVGGSNPTRPLPNTEGAPA